VYWATLATSPCSNALSYTWGTGPPSSKIDVEIKYLPIIPSLELALRHIRFKYQTLAVWVDQISINQRNQKQKNEQVTHIGQIFEAVFEVLFGLVWQK
jgi:hypothetical protein